MIPDTLGQRLLRINLQIVVDKDIMSGAPVFEGTRVPIQTLFDYLEDGCDLSEFLDNFPAVSQKAALKILTYAGENVVREVGAA